MDPFEQQSESCRHCGRVYTLSGLNKHYAQSRKCSTFEANRIHHTEMNRAQNTHRIHQDDDNPITSTELDEDLLATLSEENDIRNDFLDWQDLRLDDGLTFDEAPITAGPQSEPQFDSGMGIEVGEERSRLERCHSSRGYVTPFPDKLAGYKYEKVDTLFDGWQKKEEEAPTVFTDFANWELAHWLMTSGLSNNDRDKFFKLQRSEPLPWKSNREFFKSVEEDLPSGPSWKSETFTINGDRGSEEMTLWMRDSLECVKALIGNPNHTSSMRYTPMKVWKDETKEERVYGEMWTGNWWHRTQVRLGALDRKATIAPIILSSDKTNLSVFSGDKVAYPVYISIGNISKRVRRQPSQRATFLLCYLPVTKMDIYSNEDQRREALHNLFHRCMKTVLEPLVSPGSSGCMMPCADGYLRRVYPIVAAYAADFPEQCLITGCKQSYCPICSIDSEDRGNLIDFNRPRIKNSNDILSLLVAREKDGYSARATALGLSPIEKPFWADLPYCNIFSSITPDELHQFKGTIKDHLLKWFTVLGGRSKLDAFFQSIPSKQGLRNFDHGISHISQWTGSEVKEVEKVLLGVICGLTLPPGKTVKACKAISAYLTFIYLSHQSNISQSGVETMKTALQTFHANRDIFVGSDKSGLCRDFKYIAKFHVISHYPNSITELGTPDGYSTEYSERLHIDFAKAGYRASNHVNPIPQMTRYMHRQDLMHFRMEYLRWRDNLVIRDRTETMDSDPDADSEAECTAMSGEYVYRPCIDSSAPQGSNFHYPHPNVVLSKCPSYRESIAYATTHHHAKHLLTAIKEFGAKMNPDATSIHVTVSDFLDIWTRLRLKHGEAPLNATGRDSVEVVRASPSSRPKSKKGSSSFHPVKSRGKGYFDTALILDDRNGEGLKRFRCVRVRAIFCFTESRLKQYFPGVMVYAEPFSRFNNETLPALASSVPLPTISASFIRGEREFVIIPIEAIQMGCHLIPQFKRLPDNIKLPIESDVLEISKLFYFNVFITSLIFAYTQHWSGYV